MKRHEFNPTQMLANLRRNTPEMQAALSRDTTECYLDQLRQFDPPKSDRDASAILAEFDEYHGGAE